VIDTVVDAVGSELGLVAVGAIFVGLFGTILIQMAIAFVRGVIHKVVRWLALKTIVGGALATGGLGWLVERFVPGGIADVLLGLFEFVTPGVVVPIDVLAVAALVPA